MFLIFTDMNFLQEGNMSYPNGDDNSSPNGAGARTPFQDISNTQSCGNYTRNHSLLFSMMKMNTCIANVLTFRIYLYRP